MSEGIKFWQVKLGSLNFSGQNFSLKLLPLEPSSANSCQKLFTDDRVSSEKLRVWCLITTWILLQATRWGRSILVLPVHTNTAVIQAPQIGCCSHNNLPGNIHRTPMFECFKRYREIFQWSIMSQLSSGWIQNIRTFSFQFDKSARWKYSLHCIGHGLLAGLDLSDLQLFTMPRCMLTEIGRNQVRPSHVR